MSRDMDRFLRAIDRASQNCTEGTMRAITTAALILAAFMAVGVAEPALAQSGASERATRAERVRPRLRVTPTQRLVRQCADWYEVEARATGPTVVPASRCWWGYR
jgi:hypothetical protein